MPLPTYLLKRHPIAIEAFFDFVLVLTYAFPKSMLERLLPPGLVIDSFGDLGFVAVAMVKTSQMRPKGIPAAFGQNFFLIGYRIFTRYTTQEGRTLRGLRILRSDANRSLMVGFGNLLTHYKYNLVDVSIVQDMEKMSLRCRNSRGDLDLKVVARIGELDANKEWLPVGSPFDTTRDALKFAGPMPFTFDYEPETDSIVRVEGVRENWHPSAVPVEVEQIRFFESDPFIEAKLVLCSAFYLKDIPYWWKPGVVERVKRDG